MVIPGNHDTGLDCKALIRAGREEETEFQFNNAVVLVNETIQLEGLTFFGSPFTIYPFNIDWWAFWAKDEAKNIPRSKKDY